MGHGNIVNGIVAAVSDGKCVDVEVMTKHYESCKYWIKKKNTPEREY